MKKLVLIFLLFLLCLSAVFWFRASSSLSNKKNVIVVLIDTLRADHLGFMGYERDTSPFLDSFAKENLVFKNAMSAASWTPPSVASLFSGMYASVHGHMPLRSETEYGKRFTRLDDSFVTMAEIFKAADYDTAAISANPMVGKRYGLSQGFDLFISPGREGADKLNKRARKYLTDLRKKDKPFFLYLHYMEPHDPYEPPAPYNTMFTGNLKSRSYPEEQQNFINQYDGEIRYVDKKIEEMFSWLKAEGLYDDTVIILVADHGEQFKERGYQGHADRTYAEEIHVPMVLKANKLNGVDSTYVSLIDVLPTLTDLAGIKLQHAVHGFSLMSEMNQRKLQGIMAEIIRHVNEKAYIRQDGLKMINEYPMQKGMLIPKNQLTSEGEMLSSKLFDLNKDPQEISPQNESEIKAILSVEFLDLYQKLLDFSSRYKTSEVELDDKAIEQLKTLGYL